MNGEEEEQRSKVEQYRYRKPAMLRAADRGDRSGD